MRSHYDFIFSIGSACSCTETLRAAGLQYASFPFDWITIRDRPGDVRHKAEAICTDFRGWFDREDFEYAGTKPWHLKDFYRNRRTGIVFNHDFPKGVPFEVTYPRAREKYERRFARLQRCIRSSKTVLLVRIDRPDQEFPTTADDLLFARERLTDKFPGVRFDILFLTCERGLPYAQRRETAVADGFTHIAFDYKSRCPEAPPYLPEMDTLIAFFHERFLVRDYRTPAERKSERRRKRLARYRRFGADNVLRYRFNRLRLLLLKTGGAIRRIIAAMRAKSFDHIVPLGTAEEAAVRLRRFADGVRPSLFDRADMDGLDTLIGVLRNPQTLFTGEVELDDATKAWRCLNTGVRVRGNLRWGRPGNPPPPDAALAEDKISICTTITRQKTEFAELTRASGRTLFVLALREDDVRRPDLAKRLSDLRQLLGSGQLLVVCAGRTPRGLRDSHGVFFRSVRTFLPQDDRPANPLEDTVRTWKALFTEFHT